MKRSRSYPSCAKRLPRIGDETGMTLIELLVALVVLALILTTCYGVYARLREHQQVVEQANADHHVARALLDRLGRELRGLYRVAGRSDLGLTAGRDADGEPYLQLTTTSATPDLALGIAVVRYQLHNSRLDAGELPTLLRGEWPLYAAPDAVGQVRPVIAEVGRLEWRFFDGSDWRDSWDSGVPKLVEIQLALGTEQEQRTFTTLFDLGVAP